MRLSDALAAMPAPAFERLLARTGVSIDPAKKLSPIEQAARALAVLTPKRLQTLPGSARDALRALTPRPGRAARSVLGGGVLPLIELGLVFPDPRAPDSLALPSAYRLQLAAPPAEDARAARPLLAAIDAETYRSIAITHLGRPPVAPRPLVLGEVLDVLESPSELERVLGGLPRSQQRLLAAIEARGGEVTSDELLELAKEPARWGPSTTLPKSGALAAVLSRALLLPIGGGILALPAEVAAFVGRERRQAAVRVREDLARRIARDGEDPARARLADDPGPLAVALLAELRARQELADAQTPARRSTLRVAARELGTTPERAELLTAVARAAPLTDATLGDVRARLFSTWREGGAWDEARSEPDRLRAPEPATRLPTPTLGLRDALLEILAALPEGRFGPADAVLRAARADLRADAASAQLERAARRVPGAFVTSVDAIFRAILEHSLPALGVLDRTERGDLVRLAAPYRAQLRGQPQRNVAAPAPGARWENGGRLLVSSSLPVSRILAIAPLGKTVARERDLVLLLDRERIEQLATRGELDLLQSTLAELAPLDPSATRMLAVEAPVRVPCTLVPAAAYLEVPDDALRKAIEADAVLAPWIARSLPGGVLLREGAPMSRIDKRLRRLGGAIETSSEPR